MESSRVSQYVSFFMLLTIVILCGVLFYRVMIGFLLPLFLAALLVVIFRPVHRWTLDRCNQRQNVAAGLTTTAILLMVLIPLLWILVLAVMEGIEFAQSYSARAHENAAAPVIKLRNKLGLNIPHEPELVEILAGLQRLERLSAQGSAAGAKHVESDVQTGSESNTPAPLTALQQQTDRLGNELRRELGQDDGSSSKSASQLNDAIAELDKLQDDLLRLVEVCKEPGFVENAEFRDGVDVAKLSYGTFRQTFLGGLPWSWLVELSNPDKTQIGRWKTNANHYLRPWLLSVTGATTARIGGALLGLAIMTVGMFYFFKDGPGMISGFMRLSPLEDEYERQLLSEFDTVSRAVVVATLLSAVVQGLLAGIGYFFAGLDSIFLLTMLTMVFAMIPFVGAAAVWIPCCIWLAFSDHMVAATVLAIYGACAVSMADNVIKPFVLHGQSKLHPLLALLSVLGGVQALGPIGILVGPMVVSFLQALLNMLHTEIARMDQTPGNAGN